MKILIIYLFFVTVAYGQSSHKNLPYETSFKLLQTIDDQAILMGEGEKDIYLFIDPLCRYSRKFIKMIMKNDAMLQKYRYHIFLYEIPKLHSTQVIKYIYAQQNQLKSLLDIIVKDKKIFMQNDFKEQKIINKISDVAKQIDVYKRPYIIVSQKQK